MRLTLTVFGEGKAQHAVLEGQLTWGEYKRMFGVEGLQDTDMVSVTLQNGYPLLHGLEASAWPRIAHE